MELLKTLKLTCYQRNHSKNPVLQRRIKLAAGISEQIQLAKNPNYKQISVRTVADYGGELRAVEVSKSVLRWCRVDVDGSVKLTVRYVSRLLDKGMDTVELADADELVPVLEQFKAAAELGEMDDMLAEQITKRKNKKAVKVAE